MEQIRSQIYCKETQHETNLRLRNADSKFIIGIQLIQ